MTSVATKLVEHTYGNHTYMKLRLDDKRIEEIDVYYTDTGTVYKTSADPGMELDPEKHMIIRRKIIDAFKELF